MDHIIIKELEVFFNVGVPETERANPQKLLITVEMDVDTTTAASSDDLRQTIDYRAVAVRVGSLGRGRSFKLIETIAAEMADLVLREFQPKRVTVEIKKFVLPHTRYVAVQVTRPA